MKKLTSLLIFLSITLLLNSQTNYDTGFRDGYKAGYLYNNKWAVIPPIPTTPIPQINESSNSYQDGYNRGFVIGKNDYKKTANNTNSGSLTHRNTNIPSTFVPIDLNKISKLYEMKAEYNHLATVTFNELIEKMNEIFQSLLSNYPNDKEFLMKKNEYFTSYNSKIKPFIDLANSQKYVTSILLDKMRDYINGLQNDFLVFLDEYNIRTHFFDGHKSLKEKKYADAIKHFTVYLNKYPEETNLYFYRGIAYYKLKKLSFGENDLNKYIKSNYNNPVAYSYRGWIKYNQGNYMEALSDFNKQIELDPGSYEAYYNRGSVKSELNDYYGSISDYEKAIALKSDFSMAYNNIAWSYYSLKKYSDALKNVNKAIELDSKNYVAYDSRADIKFKLKDYRGCINDADIALSLNPKLSNSFFIKGRATYRLGDKRKACEFWSKAGELGKKEAYEYISKYCNN
jgi:tetratricopeptide (TPR) repeat protein